MKMTPETLSKLALAGDVGGLNPTEKVQYYSMLCQRVGLDPSTQPFKLMKLQGKETFYLDRSGAQQLNHKHGISHEIKSRDFVNGCYVVTARASIGNRFTDSIGTVYVEGLKGEAFANATMKAETKAKRRATLDLVGLGMLDEIEVETISSAKASDFNPPPMPQLPPGREPEKPTKPAKTYTPQQYRDSWMKKLANSGVTEEEILGYYKKESILLPTEVLADLPDAKIPTDKKQAEETLEKIKAFKDQNDPIPT